MMALETFETPAQLVAFVNDNGIVQANIQFIWCQDWHWYMLYWTEA